MRRAEAIARSDVSIQTEVEALEQLAEAIDAGATLILLDNMNLVQMRQAVGLTAGRAQLEAQAVSNSKPPETSPKPGSTVFRSAR